MSLVIDVDSHLTSPFTFKLDGSPLQRFRSQLPDEVGMARYFLAADLVSSLPAEARPDAAKLFPGKRTRADGVETPLPAFWDPTVAPTDLKARIAWMDKIGIAYSIVNGPGYPAAYPLIQDLKQRQDYIRTCNDLLMGEIAGVEHRMGVVAYADLTDLDWAIEELTRLRKHGSRAFSLLGAPVNGLSLGHKHFDRLWSALEDLGMIASLHVGLAPAEFGAWGNLGYDFDTPEGRGVFLRMANSQRYQSAELLLSSLLLGGVFARHPKLSVLIAELFTFWMPNFVRRMEMISAGNPLSGPWPYDKPAGVYLREQVRATPLPGLGDRDAVEVIKALPEMIAFSSDYPHSEGNADPINLYGAKLDELPADMREGFLSRNIAKSFERMGDPLVAMH
jgi:predicted TIM-barrel fold metal-dependent hydrolase